MGKYYIYILTANKKDKRSYPAVLVRSYSYDLLKLLDMFLSIGEDNQDKDSESLKTGFETETLDVHHEIDSEVVYDALIRTCLRVWRSKEWPIEVENNRIPVLRWEKTDNQNITKKISDDLVELASAMLEARERINWKKDVVQMLITNTPVIF